MSLQYTCIRSFKDLKVQRKPIYAKVTSIWRIWMHVGFCLRLCFLVQFTSCSVLPAICIMTRHALNNSELSILQLGVATPHSNTQRNAAYNEMYHLLCLVVCVHFLEHNLTEKAKKDAVLVYSVCIVRSNTELMNSRWTQLNRFEILAWPTKNFSVDLIRVRVSPKPKYS